MSDTSAGPGLRGRLARVAGHFVALAQTRFELLVVELEEERDRLGRLVTCALVAFFFLGFGLLALAMLLTVMLWDTQRLLPLAVLSALLLGAGALAAVAAWQAVARGSRLFAASLGELALDRASIDGASLEPAPPRAKP